MAGHNDLGKKGEALAGSYLVANGYEIIAKNWTYGKAEIDLIAYLNGTIIFVEVKARSSVAFGHPEEFVDGTKQKLMNQAANAYIEQMNHQGEIRFDIVSILFNQQQHYTINHIEDAFWPID